METVYFAAGCFWSVEHKFSKLPGVESTAVGYMNGTTEDPTYKEVCTDTTGHAEVVKVVFNPSNISFESLCQEFWQLHNPTTINRQGPDTGSQYRTAIFFTSTEQQQTAEKVKESISAKFEAPIVTEITAALKFYKAEEYHQKYIVKNGQQCGF